MDEQENEDKREQSSLEEGGKRFYTKQNWGQLGKTSRGNLEGMGKSRREGGDLDWARRRPGGTEGLSAEDWM